MQGNVLSGGDKEDAGGVVAGKGEARWQIGGVYGEGFLDENLTGAEGDGLAVEIGGEGDDVRRGPLDGLAQGA